jgi:hypothetical protein
VIYRYCNNKKRDILYSLGRQAATADVIYRFHSNKKGAILYSQERQQAATATVICRYFKKGHHLPQLTPQVATTDDLPL